MTQEELSERIEVSLLSGILNSKKVERFPLGKTKKLLLNLINKHVDEVIGPDLNHKDCTEWCPQEYINAHKSLQRVRGGIKCYNSLSD